MTPSTPASNTPSMPAAPSGDERRLHARIAFHTAARLGFAGRTVDVAVLDISLKGALLRLPAEVDGSGLDEGAICQLEVALDDTSGAIRMDARVAHVGEGLLGVVCRTIDIDSATHLRRLVELNLGDPALLERELSALIAD